MLDRFQRLYDIVRQLRAPDGCPWDREQSPFSIRGNLLEETLECIDAVEEQDVNHVREELGDIFLLATMLGYMYEEQGSFTISDVLDEINQKLIRRHPHVFGDVQVVSSDEVLKNWEHIKQNVENNSYTFVLDSVSPGLHPLERAFKLQKKASKYGFDWPEKADVYDKVSSELEECRQAERAENKEALYEELGDLLFSVINLCRFLSVDPALALHRTNKKFVERFSYVEERMRSMGKTLESKNMDLMDSLWEEAKDQPDAEKTSSNNP